MRATILQRDGAALIAIEHDALAEERHRTRLPLLELPRHHHRVPVLLEPQRGSVVARIAGGATLQSGDLDMLVHGVHLVRWIDLQSKVSARHSSPNSPNRITR